MGKAKSFKWSVKRICGMVDNMINNEFDCLIAIAGKRGLGKSTLGWHILKGTKICKLNAWRDLLYERQDVIDFFNKRWKAKAMGDEMINVTFNRDFYNEDQKDLIKIMNMNRDHGNVFIMCVPNFESLDTQIKDMVKIRIDVIKRGIAIVQTQNKTIFSSDRWDKRTNEKLERDWFKTSMSPRPKYSQLTTFRGYVTWKAMSERDEVLYKAIKKEKRNVILEKKEEDNVERDPRKKIYQFLLDKKIGNFREFDAMCLMNDLDPMVTQAMIRRWMRQDNIREGIKDFYIDNIKKQKQKMESTVGALVQ
jgi:hypothetical protein